jgi:hypothetical protein
MRGSFLIIGIPLRGQRDAWSSSWGADSCVMTIWVVSERCGGCKQGNQQPTLHGSLTQQTGGHYRTRVILSLRVKCHRQLYIYLLWSGPFYDPYLICCARFSGRMRYCYRGLRYIWLISKPLHRKNFQYLAVSPHQYPCRLGTLKNNCTRCRVGTLTIKRYLSE